MAINRSMTNLYKDETHLSRKGVPDAKIDINNIPGNFIWVRRPTVQLTINFDRSWSSLIKLLFVQFSRSTATFAFGKKKDFIENLFDF